MSDVNITAEEEIRLLGPAGVPDTEMEISDDEVFCTFANVNKYGPSVKRDPDEPATTSVTISTTTSLMSSMSPLCRALPTLQSQMEVDNVDITTAANTLSSARPAGSTVNLNATTAANTPSSARPAGSTVNMNASPTAPSNVILPIVNTSTNQATTPTLSGALSAAAPERSSSINRPVVTPVSVPSVPTPGNNVTVMTTAAGSNPGSSNVYDSSKSSTTAPCSNSATSTTIARRATAASSRNNSTSAQASTAARSAQNSTRQSATAINPTNNNGSGNHQPQRGNRGNNRGGRGLQRQRGSNNRNNGLNRQHDPYNIMFRDDPPEIVHIGHMVQHEAHVVGINIPELAARDLLLHWRDQSANMPRRQRC